MILFRSKAHKEYIDTKVQKAKCGTCLRLCAQAKQAWKRKQHFQVKYQSSSLKFYHKAVLSFGKFNKHYNLLFCWFFEKSSSLFIFSHHKGSDVNFINSPHLRMILSSGVKSSSLFRLRQCDTFSSSFREANIFLASTFPMLNILIFTTISARLCLYDFFFSTVRDFIMRKKKLVCLHQKSSF